MVCLILNVRYTYGNKCIYLPVFSMNYCFVIVSVSMRHIFKYLHPLSIINADMHSISQVGHCHYLLRRSLEKFFRHHAPLPIWDTRRHLMYIYRTAVTKGIQRILAIILRSIWWENSFLKAGYWTRLSIR